MKKVIYFLFILVTTFVLDATGQKLRSQTYADHKEFYFQWDNDIYLFKDYYYTQGAQLYLVNPKLRYNPANHLFFKLKNADNYFGLGAIQEIYTPKDVVDTLLAAIDRPYSGTLYLRSFLTSSVPERHLRLTSQFDIGFLGPLSGAEQAQQLIHEWLGLNYPQGWNFQIDNRPYLNYNIILDKGLLRNPRFFDFTVNARARIGNIHDDFQLGFLFRTGQMNNLFKGLNLGNTKYTDNRNFEMYFFGKATGMAVLYNATLMGGIIAPEDQHEFSYNEIKHFIGEFEGGIRINYRFMGAEGKVTWKTPEFETGEQHGWGSISMFFRL